MSPKDLVSRKIQKSKDLGPVARFKETAPLLDVPLYLQPPPDVGAHSYGTVTYNGQKKAYTITAEPAVLEFAKRLFPGSGFAGQGRLEFKATRRAVGDLNWLLLRFPMVVDAARFAADREEAIAHALRRDNNASLPPTPAPVDLLLALLEHQPQAVSYLVNNRRALLADDTGLGKTITALAAVSTASAFPALIVVQPHMIRQWTTVINQTIRLRESLQAAGQPDLGLGGAPSTPELVHRIKGLKPYELPKVPFHVTHYGLLRGWREQLVEYGYQSIIFDEIQELRHMGTEKYNVASLVADTAPYVFGLSATPFYGYGSEIFSVLNVVDFACLGDHSSFIREWCSRNGKAVDNPDALNSHLLREGLMLRRRKEDVKDKLPPKRRVLISVDKDDDQYADLVDEAITLAEGYDDIGDHLLRGRTKQRIEEVARRATGIAKAPMVASFVRGLVEAGERVLVFAHHLDVHHIINEQLKSLAPAKMTGEETPVQKERELDRFMSGDTDIIQIALRSSAGIDGLQKRATVVVFAELDYSPAVHSQAEDRLQRYGIEGGLESVLCYYLVTDTGSDETIQTILGLKVAQFVSIMGDRSETEEDKRLAAAAAERHMRGIIDSLKALGATRKKPKKLKVPA